MNSKLLVRLVLIGIALLAVGLFVGATNQFMPFAASAEAKATDSLFNFMIVIATIIFLIVEGLIVYSIFRFRKKPGDETDGPPIHGSTALEITWTAIPAIIVFGLSIYSYQVFANTQGARDGETVIRVKGQQFIWSFDYIHPDGVQAIASSELHVPVNKPIKMEIQAADVMHGFWIPEFRIKEDAIPGRTTEVRFTPTAMGDYNVVCYELCGTGHALMHNPVKVESQEAYDAYVLSLEVKEIKKPAQADAAYGKYLIQTNPYGCAGCHYLDDAGIKGQVGPSWNGIGDRAATRVPGQDAKTYITHSILYPNEYVVSGYPAGVMPQNYSERMDDIDLNSIVNYLLSQKDTSGQKAAQAQ